MQKKIFFLTLIFLTASVTYAEKNWPASKIGITFSSFGENDVVRFHELEGAAGYLPDQFFVFGINYQQPLNKLLDFETGIEYAYHKIIVSPNLPPDVNSADYGSSFSLMSIPLSVRLNFLKFCFVHAGLLLDIDADQSSPIDNQTGIGSNLGIGLNYDFNFGLSLFVNPYFKIHALLPFSMDNYPQRVIESGIRLGILYQLKKEQ